MTPNDRWEQSLHVLADCLLEQQRMHTTTADQLEQQALLGHRAFPGTQDLEWRVAFVVDECQSPDAEVAEVARAAWESCPHGHWMVGALTGAQPLALLSAVVACSRLPTISQNQHRQLESLEWLVKGARQHGASPEVLDRLDELLQGSKWADALFGLAIAGMGLEHQPAAPAARVVLVQDAGRHWRARENGTEGQQQEYYVSYWNRCAEVLRVHFPVPPARVRASRTFPWWEDTRDVERWAETARAAAGTGGRSLLERVSERGIEARAVDWDAMVQAGLQRSPGRPVRDEAADLPPRPVAFDELFDAEAPDDDADLDESPSEDSP